MSTDRIILAESLPLRTPLTIQFFVTSFCNFKCSYCLCSLKNKSLDTKKSECHSLNLDLFKKAVDSIKEYPDKIKKLTLSGVGEPLLHKNICEMVAYAKQSNIAEQIEIITNGSLLNREMSDGLIDAGLDRLRVSIQGTNAEAYRRVSQVDLDYNAFLENITYFYSKKQHTDVYIKIINIALDDQGDEYRFKKLFTPIADTVAIEYAVPVFDGIRYEIYNKEFSKGMRGNDITSEICSLPFYTQSVNTNGDVHACCAPDTPLVLGNIREISLRSIWSSKIQNTFLYQMLSNRSIYPACTKRTFPQYLLREEDFLDTHKGNLIKKYRRIIHSKAHTASTL